MIPKTIHYCWFGGKPKPKLAEKCIASWKKYCPDYRIIEWNEQNFDIAHSPQYVQQAYAAKKYAFVSDYVRLWAMVTFGGFYMDTDVELVKTLESFLKYDALSGFETDAQIPTGLMACQKDQALFTELLHDYDGISFLKDDGTYDLTTNVRRITKLCLRHGFVPNGKFQTFDGFTIYPSDYFCPFDPATGILHKTKNTVAIHWFNKSWLSPTKKIRVTMARPFHRVFGNDCFNWIKGKKHGH